MNEYVHAHLGRRGVTAFVNLIALSVLMYPLQWGGIDDLTVYSILQVLGVFLCTYFYWSPGKLLLNLKVLKDDGTELSLKERIVRNLPLMVFFAVPILPLRDYSRQPGEEFVFDLVQFLPVLLILVVSIFLLCNFLTPLFEKKDRTLLDLKLESYVGMYPQRLKLNR